MNEFLLFALIIVYLAIRYGTTANDGSPDRRDSENEQPPLASDSDR